MIINELWLCFDGANHGRVFHILAFAGGFGGFWALFERSIDSRLSIDPKTIENQ